MSHLTLETLARLVDDAPDEVEGAHLRACADCARELEALVEQSAALATLPAMMPPPDGWPELRARLREEGLVRARPRGRLRVDPGLRRAAAAALLFLGGGVMGYAVRGAPAALPPAAGQVAATPAEEDATRVAGGPATDAAVHSPADEGETASETFLAALDHYMASTGSPPDDPAARLAALDNIVLTTAEALHEAPSDPVINRYYMTALAQRNAVLRQLAASTGQPIF